jgi:hypothetical protein
MQTNPLQVLIWAVKERLYEMAICRLDSIAKNIKAKAAM